MAASHGRRLTVKEKALRYKQTHRGMGLYQSIGLTLLLLVVLLAMGGWSLSSMSRYATVSDDNVVDMGRSSDVLFEGTFVGDINLARGEDRLASVGGVDSIFSRTQALWQSSDVVMGNLECVLMEDGKRYHESAKGISLLGANADYALGLKNAGFNVLSLANEHSMDYKARGLQSTIQALQGVGIEALGAGEFSAEAGEPIIKDIDGFKVALFSASDVLRDDSAATMTSSGIATVNNSDLFMSIYEVRDSVDLVIVNVHWGYEYTSTENEDQVDLAHDLIDAGADVVVGEHSHTLQPVELYQGKLIVYGMGDYSHDNAWTRTKDGMVVQIRVDQDRNMTADLRFLRIENGIPSSDPGELYEKRDRATVVKHLDETEYSADGPCVSIPLGSLAQIAETNEADLYEEEGREGD